MHKVFVSLAVSLGAAAVLSGTALASDKEAAAQPESKPVPKVHVVEAGDSLSSIADAEKLDSWRPLWDVNNDLENPDLIYAGQKLTVPDGPTQERPLPAGVVTQPVQQSYAAPKQQGYVAPKTVRQATAANYAAGASGVLAHIRAGESGGNYATNTGNGYYGAYQFDLGTWRGVGGTGLPSQASPAEQDMRAQMLYDRRGCSPWPNTCR
jgi:LysM repeat protein